MGSVEQMGLMTTPQQVEEYLKELKAKYAYLDALEIKNGGFSHPLIVAPTSQK